MGADLVRGVVIRGAGERIVPSTRGRESAARGQIDDTGGLPAVEHTVDGAMQGAPTRKAVDRGDIGAGSSQGSSPPHMLSYNTGRQFYPNHTLCCGDYSFLASWHRSP